MRRSRRTRRLFAAAVLMAIAEGAVGAGAAHAAVVDGTSNTILVAEERVGVTAAARLQVNAAAGNDALP